MVDADDTRRDTTPEENPDSNPEDNTPQDTAQDPPDAPTEGGETAPAAKTAKKAAAKKTTAKKTAAKKTAAKTPAKKTLAKKTTAKKAAVKKAATPDPPADEAPAEAAPADEAPAEAAPTGRTRKSAAKKTSGKRAAAEQAPSVEEAPAGPAEAPEPAAPTEDAESAQSAPRVLFQAPEPRKKSTSSRRKKAAEPEHPAPAEGLAGQAPDQEAEQAAGQTAEPAADTTDTGTEAEAVEGAAEEGAAEESAAGARRRRRRGGRRRRRAGDGDATDTSDTAADEQEAQKGHDGEDSEDQEGGGSRRRRKRRRSGDEDASSDDPQKTVTRVRKSRNPEDEITSVSGSTRLEAKKQRRREGREAGRRRAPIVSEAEFLARREAVERVMVIRQREDLTQIAVLEDKVLVEHYVAREAQTSLIGNVYLGRVQNVLPSMEAAFIDIGKGRNAVLYAGEVNWSALGHQDGQPRKIESVLSSGQTVLVQVTKDPIGHKGARLTGQVSLPGRFLVYVPDGTTSGISRKLPDTERTRLKTLLKEIVPDTAGVIVRTAAEGASEEELTRDVERLTARWADIDKKVAAGKGPELLYGEPDLTLKVVRDLFTEDFSRLVVQGDDAWDLVEGYVSHVAPDLRERLERFQPDDGGAQDVFAAHRVDEQIAKGLDRKVWLPSGGSLIIDRTEAMTVVDVNTGKFTGSGGNLEETVTKNNLEAAEEIVRQLRLRDIGGIIVVDFIDMVLESNRELVLRRLVECLGRDRTRHQVAEVTSLGLVQMTRKRIGTGLLEAFSEECPHCKGRGVLVHEHPVEHGKADDDQRGRRGRGGRGRGSRSGSASNGSGNGSGDGHGSNGDGGRKADPAAKPSPMDLVGTRPPAPQPEPAEAPEGESEQPPVEQPVEPVEEAAATPQPEAPRVVTTTRRRTVRRPAGAPTPREESSYDPNPAEATEPDPAAEVAEPDAEPDADTDAETETVAHVPIKRKGARKR